MRNNDGKYSCTHNRTVSEGMSDLLIFLFYVKSVIISINYAKIWIYITSHLKICIKIMKNQLPRIQDRFWAQPLLSVMSFTILPHIQVAHLYYFYFTYN
jgi:hypothetical protein